MNCSKLLTALLCFPFFTACTNTTKPEQKEPVKDSLGYVFSVPPKWTTEEFPFPVSFAPQLPYNGVEVLRFAPGWAATASEEHWSYTFLWRLEGQPVFDAAVLQQNLTDYYTGLLKQNIRERNIPSNKITLPSVFIQKTETAAGDTETWNGTVTMTDYLDIMYNTMKLNCVVHKKDCGSSTALLFEISLQPGGHAVRQEMEKMVKGFGCK
jgi:hypothetical protein